MRAAATHPPLVTLVLPDEGAGRAARQILLALAGTLLLTVSAKVQLPMWPVPMTMQTFAVLVIGMAFGARLGAATVVLYLLQGAVGLPVFASGGGIAYFSGPTAGYLIGFAVAAFAVGALAERGWDRGPVRTLGAMLVGTLIIFALGVGWLAILLGDPTKALNAGLLPFLPGEALKIALAALVLPALWRRFDGTRTP